MFVGIDIAHISRFTSLIHKTAAQRARIFAEREELELAKQVSEYDQARYLASRWAMKEAAYKAMSSAFSAPTTQHTVAPFPFLACARFITISKDSDWGCPHIKFDYNGFARANSITLPPMTFSVSISHEKEYAACVVNVWL